ncbi:Phosphatidylinositol-3-phosphatase SAC1 [Coemansia sp. S610]|nr:Phosphatidylinositol-3-phosphatase SAC1 [Coemansia sp. S610]
MSEPTSASDMQQEGGDRMVEEHASRDEPMLDTTTTRAKSDAANATLSVSDPVDVSKPEDKKPTGKRSRDSDDRDAGKRKSRSRSMRSRSRRDYSRRRYDDDYYRSLRRYDDDRYERRGSRRSSPARQRSSSRSPSGERGYRRRSSGGRRSPSPEVDESERDLRTVFAMQLSARLHRSDLVDFFSQAGRVRDAHIVADKGSRRSRGVAYVEFYTIDSAIKAVDLSGQRLLEVPIIVQPSEAQKNRQSTMKQYSADGAPLSASSDQAGTTLVFARELAVDIEPEDLKAFFDLFGKVEYCHVEPVADTGRDGAEWSAFVKYDMVSSARFAVDKMNGLPLLGTKLRVRMARKSEEERESRRLSGQTTGKAEGEREPRRHSGQAADAQLMQLPPPATTVNPAAAKPGPE